MNDYMLTIRQRFLTRSALRWLLVIFLLAALAVLLTLCFTRPPGIPDAPITAAPTLTPSPTLMPTRTLEWTPTSTPLSAPTATFTRVFTPTPTATSSPIPTDTPQPSFTPTDAPTNSPTAIDTTIPGRALTPVLGTATPTIPPLPHAGADWWTVIHLKKLRGR